MVCLRVTWLQLGGNDWRAGWGCSGYSGGGGGIQWSTMISLADRNLTYVTIWYICKTFLEPTLAAYFRTEFTYF